MSEAILYDPHDGQEPLHEARRAGFPGIVAQCGRRFGKGRFGIGDIMETYDEVFNMERSAELVPPFHAWIVAPASPQSRQIWHEIISLVPKSYIVHRDIREQMVWFRGGKKWQGRAGLLEIKSAFVPESLQSTGLDHLWITESQDVPNEAFEKVLPTLRSPDRLGRSYFEGIPATYPDHWFERIFKVAKTSDRYFAFHATYLDNPLLSPEQLEAIEEDKEFLSASSWERLYLARFSQNAGFFRNVGACVYGDLISVPIPGASYVAGLDIGWTNDSSVMIIMDQDKRRVIAHFEWDASFSWVDTREHIIQIATEWGLKEIIFDASSGGGKAIEEDLGNTALPITPYAIVGERRRDMLEALAGALERQTISYPDIKILQRQLFAMQYRPRKDGRYQLQVPTGEHDDYIFALALCLMACNEATLPMQLAPLTRHRYIQSQREMTNRSITVGARLMKDRRLERLRKRVVVIDETV